MSVTHTKAVQLDDTQEHIEYRKGRKCMQFKLVCNKGGKQTLIRRGLNTGEKTRKTSQELQHGIVVNRTRNK